MMRSAQASVGDWHLGEADGAAVALYTMGAAPAGSASYSGADLFTAR